MKKGAIDSRKGRLIAASEVGLQRHGEEVAVGEAGDGVVAVAEEPADGAFEGEVVAQAPGADGARETRAIGDVPGAEDADLPRLVRERPLAADDEADVGIAVAGGVAALQQQRAAQSVRSRSPVGAGAVTMVSPVVSAASPRIAQSPRTVSTSPPYIVKRG